MWNPFRKKGLPPVIVNMAGGFEQVWVRKRMPDPGAESYAYESEDLPLMTPIGAGVAVRVPLFKPLSRGPQPYFPRQQVALQGFGTVSGGIVSQPLFNPQYPAYGGVGFRRANDPFTRQEIQPAAG